MIKGQVKFSPERALELTLEWNRVDLAEMEVFNKRNTLHNNKLLANIMIKAIKSDNVDFVQLLIRHGLGFENLFQNDDFYKEIEGFYSDYKYEVCFFYFN